MREIFNKAIKNLEESNSPMKRFVILPAVKDELNKLGKAMKIYTRILNNGKREIVWLNEEDRPVKCWSESNNIIIELPNPGWFNIDLYEQISEDTCSVLMSQTPIQLTIHELQNLMYLATCEYDMNESERTGMSKDEGVQRFIKRILNERLFNK
jgi:hypothetical protein